MIVNRSKCPTLVTALNGGYRFKYNTIGEAQPAPEKNRYSHVADAHQYLCMAASGGTANAIARRVTRARELSHNQRRKTVTAQGWT
jgi:hypothetical protein